MRASQIILRFRDVVKDHGLNNWGAEEALRYLNTAQLMLYREQMQRDASYHTQRIAILGTAAVQTHSSQYEYILPWYVDRVTGVKETSSSTDSPQRWLSASHAEVDTPGYKFVANNRVRVTGDTTPLDIDVDVTKPPARMHSGACSAVGTATTMISKVLDTTDSQTSDEYEQEPNGYANAMIEMTGVTTGTHDPVGQIRRVLSSVRTSSTTDYRITFTVDRAWTEIPDTDDTYEFHPEVPDHAVRLLVLNMARQAFQQHGNLAGMQVIESDYNREWSAFVTAVTPRDDGHATYWQSNPDGLTGSDPDRDILLGLTGGY